MLTGEAKNRRASFSINFPPFSVGETGRTGGASRREIGHGALAERSLEPVIPGVENFRYAIRISSEIMESNGSTSMASVCAERSRSWMRAFRSKLRSQEFRSD